MAGTKILGRNRQQCAGQTKNRQQKQLFNAQRHTIGGHRRGAKTLQIILHNKTGRHHHGHCHGDRHHLFDDLVIGIGSGPKTGSGHASHQISAHHTPDHINHDAGLAERR